MVLHMHPVNAVLRFFLELAALAALGYWGWTQHDGAARWLWALGLPVVAAAAWAVFRIPGDHGKPIIPVRGPVRLLLETVFFGGAVWLLALAGRPTWALVLGVLLLGHYLWAYRRVVWMLQQ